MLSRHTCEVAPGRTWRRKGSGHSGSRCVWGLSVLKHGPRDRQLQAGGQGWGQGRRQDGAEAGPSWLGHSKPYWGVCREGGGEGRVQMWGLWAEGREHRGLRWKILKECAEPRVWGSRGARGIAQL